ncbi:DUF1287 domain-containing protein [Paracoccus sp. IB05]|uniref:DUF1287 domain-containing protein n=1 Tax=Paracoccus sp. IB05 TaxID=2779367 RepID=UPI0018E8AA95|nr:DUF1287 domain-containing protein [Paracoccus sp. IB05]MBJ2153738.1 DUF1287 domain-containing protein [Paracoccus sp. IB05]
MIRRSVLGLLAVPFVMPAVLRAEGATAGQKIAQAAEAQEGVVRIYDPAYVALDFPGGDVAPDRGVCTDVLVRALRVAEGIDLQVAINRDMKADFAAYPKNWGLTRTDRNIDHRRVPNLRRLFERVGAELPVSETAADHLPGDVVTCLIPGDLAHLMVVGTGLAGPRPLIVHNIGAGTRIEDRLLEFRMTGRYRLTPPVLEKLRRLSA